MEEERMYKERLAKLESGNIRWLELAYKWEILQPSNLVQNTKWGGVKELLLVAPVWCFMVVGICWGGL